MKGKVVKIVLVIFMIFALALVDFAKVGLAFVTYAASGDVVVDSEYADKVSYRDGTFTVARGITTFTFTDNDAPKTATATVKTDEDTDADQITNMDPEYLEWTITP